MRRLGLGLVGLFGMVRLTLAQTEELDESRALRLLDVQTAIAAWQEAGPELAIPGLHRVDINLATADELAALPGATPAGAAAILRYRSAYGRFSEVSELNAVEDLSTAEAAALAPFLFVQEPKQGLPKAAEALGRAARPYLLLRGQTAWPRTAAYGRPDFAENRTSYAGDAWGVLARLRGSLPQRLSYGLVLEKDPGEALVPKPGTVQVDYVSAHVLLRNQGRLKALVLGDYQLALGQGLAFGRSFVLGRGAEPVLTLAQTSPGILPYNAVVEGRALRGAAATYRLTPGWEATAFGSAKRVDAMPVQAPDSLAAASADAVGPPRYTGLHRTEGELAARRALPEYLGGVSVQWAPQQSFGHVGLVAARQVYGRALTQEARRPGLAQAQSFGSVWYRTRVRGVALYGEVSVREGMAPAYVQIVQWLPTPRTGLGLSLRHLPSGSAGGYGQPFAQSLPVAGGEQGIYLALTQKLGRFWQMAAYQDYYRPVSATPSDPLPTPQVEWALQSLFTPSKTNEALIQLRARRSLNPDIGVASESASLYPTGLGLQGVTGARVQAAPWLTLAAQLRASSLAGQAPATERQKGWAAYQQAQIRVGWVQATLRAYVYETDSYAARLVFYEPGVLYQPKALQAYGSGTRLMALLNLRLPGAGNLYLKLARTQPRVGEASTELTMQVRFWLNGRQKEDRFPD